MSTDLVFLPRKVKKFDRNSLFKDTHILFSLRNAVNNCEIQLEIFKSKDEKCNTDCGI